MILGAFGGSGIRAVGFKGGVIGAVAYGHLVHRRSFDIDILVAESDVEAAAGLLEKRGYERHPKVHAGSREIHFVRPADRAIVDLHWNVVAARVPFALDFDELWNRRGQASVGGVKVAVPSVEWLLLLNALYVFKDLPRLRLAYLADAVRLLRRHEGVDWSYLHELSGRTGTLGIVALTLLLAVDPCGVELSARAQALFPASPSVRRARDHLVQHLEPPDGEGVPHLPMLRSVMAQARLRERSSDRLATYWGLVALALRPSKRDMALGAWLGGGMAPLTRLVRLPSTFACAAMRRLLRRSRRSLETARLARRERVWMLGHRALRPAPGLSLHILDDEGLLLDSRGSRLFALSTTATFLWCQLEDGLTRPSVIAAYARTFEVSEGTAQVAIDGLVGDWRALGLLEGAPDPGVVEPIGGSPVSAVAFDQPVELVATRSLRILDTCFRVGFSSFSQIESALPVLGPFLTERTEPSSTEALVVQDGSETLVVIDEVIVASCPDASELASTLKAELVVAALNRYPLGIYLHAAVMRAAHGCLLLPARPGSGKTTLAAGLARAGFAYHSDEFAVLDRERLAVRGLPVCLTLKEGAWTTLAPLYPEIASLPVHHRVDGKIVRYLPPPAQSDDPALDRHWPVRWLVFPRYRAGAPTRLAPVRRTEALRRLLDECLALRLTLNDELVERLVEWIAGIACFELEHGDLDTAVSALRELCVGQVAEPVSAGD